MYISSVINYDPTKTLQDISVATLALFGENDRLVPPESNVQRLQEHFGTRSANTDLYIDTIPGVNHGFERSDFCERTIESDQLVAEVFDALDNREFWSSLGQTT